MKADKVHPACANICPLLRLWTVPANGDAGILNKTPASLRISHSFGHSFEIIALRRNY
jgi:hypothetical protein